MSQWQEHNMAIVLWCTNPEQRYPQLPRFVSRCTGCINLTPTARYTCRQPSRQKINIAAETNLHVRLHEWILSDTFCTTGGLVCEPPSFSRDDTRAADFAAYSTQPSCMNVTVLSNRNKS